jgi:hypothetical protein
MFKATTREQFAHDIATLIASEPAGYGSARIMERAGRRLRDTDPFVCHINPRQESFDAKILGAREYSGTIQVMSDIWGTEYIREVLVWGYDDKTKEWTLHWVRDGYGSSEHRDADVVIDGASFYTPKPENVDAKDYDAILKWINEKAGQAEADKAATERGEEFERQERTPSRDKVLKVVRGRKIKVGTVGKCAVYKKFPGFRGRSDSYRVGFALDDSKDSRGWYSNVVWTDACNVEVHLTEAEEKDLAARRVALEAKLRENVKAQARQAWMKLLEEYGVGQAAIAGRLAA